MQVNPKEIASGLLFVAIGAFFAVNAWFNLRIGRAVNMGPGYFPVVLGAILAGFGVAIAFSGINRPAEAFGRVSWRGVVLVLTAVAFFGATVRGLGLGPSLGIATFMAAMAPSTSRLLTSILFSIGMAIFGVAVFLYALKLPYPAIGPWLMAPG